MNILPLGGEFFHADRQKDGYDKPNNLSSQSRESP